MRRILEEFGAQGKESSSFAGAEKTVSHYFTFEVYTTLDLQGVEHTIRGVASDLEVNVPEVNLRNDSAKVLAIIFMLPQGGNADLDGSEGREGGQERRHITNIVSRQKFEVGEAKELPEFLGRETAFENV